MLNKFLIFLLSFCAVFYLTILPVKAAETVEVAHLFEVTCAGCHPNGGNIIRRGKTLKQKALKRYNMDSLTAITDIITNGKGVMSAYGDRLTPSDIQALANFVLTQAESNWQ